MSVELYNHNKDAYEKVIKHFEKTNRTCVIHPTGSGKSYISLKFIEDNINNKTLVLAPTYQILDQFNRSIARDILGIDINNKTQSEINNFVLNTLPNLNFSIYANVGKIKNENYDSIVLDEFHRVGSEVWGEGTKSLLDNNPEAKILGVTATPIRYLDDFRNMADEIFNGDIASEITLGEAIARGILPAPTYVSAVYSFEEQLSKIEKKIEDYKDLEKKEELRKKIKEARNKIEKADGLSEIFQKYIKKNDGKFIVFCKDINHLKQMEDEVSKWFEKNNSEIEISEVHSYNDKILNQEVIDAFSKDNSKKLKLLFSVEMLNEGLHVDDIDGVIMLRPTGSPIIYMQQIGRALSVGHNSNPLVFDIVNNYQENIEIYNLFDQVKEEIENIKNGIEGSKYYGDGSVDDILDKFKIFDEMIDLKKELDDINIEASYTWDDYYKLAKVYYEHYGHLNIPQRFKTLNGINEVKEDDPRYKDAVILGNWLGNQRRNYFNKKMPTDKIQKLESIGMIWDILEYEWNENFKWAKVYYEHYGHLNIPQRFKTLNGINEVKEDDPRYKDAVILGKWLGNQRTNYFNKKMPTDKIQKLESIGMIWDILEYEWNKNFKLAKAYYEKYGHLRINVNYITFDGVTEIKEDDSRYKDAIRLGMWLGRQRSNYLKKKMPTDKIQKLESIGMIWDINEDLWNLNYKLAKAYYEKYGHLNIPQRFKTLNGINEVKEDDPRYKDAVILGRWLGNQRTNYFNKKMPTDKIQKLESIGMIWDILEYEWNENFKLAKGYYEKYGHLNIPQKFKTLNGINEVKEDDPRYKDAVILGKWLSNQRSNYLKKKMPTDKIQKLESIGMIWDIKEDFWNLNYKLAKVYYEHYGHLNIPQKFRTLNGINEVKEDDPRYKDAIRLGMWLGGQRRKFLNNKLPSKYIKKLEAIGMVCNQPEQTDESTNKKNNIKKKNLKY